MRGVHLMYVEPRKNRDQYNLSRAQAAGDQRWIDNIERSANRQHDQSYHFGIFDWWRSEKDFLNNAKGFSGVTFVDLEDKYPNLQIMHSKEEAIRAAEEAGII
jgi:hypothetical protein